MADKGTARLSVYLVYEVIRPHPNTDPLVQRSAVFLCGLQDTTSWFFIVKRAAGGKVMVSTHNLRFYPCPALAVQNQREVSSYATVFIQYSCSVVLSCSVLIQCSTLEQLHLFLSLHSSTDLSLLVLFCNLLSIFYFHALHVTSKHLSCRETCAMAGLVSSNALFLKCSHYFIQMPTRGPVEKAFVFCPLG